MQTVTFSFSWHFHSFSSLHSCALRVLTPVGRQLLPVICVLPSSFVFAPLPPLCHFFSRPVGFLRTKEMFLFSVSSFSYMSSFNPLTQSPTLGSSDSNPTKTTEESRFLIHIKQLRNSTRFWVIERFYYRCLDAVGREWGPKEEALQPDLMKTE